MYRFAEGGIASLGLARRSRIWLGVSVAGAALCVPAVAAAQSVDGQSTGTVNLGASPAPGDPAAAPGAATVDSLGDTPSTAAGGLEEIVVTAQKRSQRLQDVPIAITALSAETIQANRITSVQDLSGLAPNVIVRPAAGGSAIPSFSMRGLTSFGVVPGSDKQVSINLDGVYISATRGALFELPDIARIEVLRGPQGTLFGRNATAGAVSIVTKDPDGRFGGRIETSVGNYDQKRVRASIDLPQIGPFSGYVSFVHNEREGDIRNLGAGTVWDRSGVGTFNGRTYDSGVGVQTSPDRLGDKNVETYLAAVKFEPSDTIRAIYKYDLSVDHSTPEGVGVVAINTAQPSGGAGALIIGAVAANQPAGGGPFGPVVFAPDGKRPKAVNNFYTTPSFLKNRGHNLTAEFDVSDSVSIKNIAAYRKSLLNPAVSQVGGLGGLVLTQGAVNALAPVLIPNFALIPVAFRPQAIAGLAASFGGIGSRLVDVGTNIQNLSKQWSNETQINYDSDFATITVGGIYFRSEDRSGVPQFIRGTANLTFFPATGEVPLGSTGVSFNKATSIAGFAQAEFHVTPQLDIVAGGRLTRDRKSGSFITGLTPAGVSVGTFTSNVAGCPTNTSNPVGACRLSGTYANLSTSSFTYRDTRPIYSIGLNYKPLPDILTYAKYSTGYVSGGSIGGVAFKPETVRAAEAGIKADFLDRRLRTNLALFHAKYRNVQSSQSGRNVGRGDLGTVIITGFNERATGFEFEVTAVPTDGLTLSGSLGHTDIRLSNVSLILLTSVLVTGQPLPVNYRPVGTPKWTSNLSAQYESSPLFAEATILARVDGLYRSKLIHDSNADRATLIPGFAPLEFSPSQWLLNGRVALRNIKVGRVSAELAVWGRNLTNDRDAQFPLITPFEGSTSYQAARTYGADLIFKF